MIRVLRGLVSACFHAGQHEALSLREELVGLPLLLRQELLHELVVCVLQLLVHASHDSNVVVVDEVDFFKVENLRQLACLIGEEKVSDGLRLEWKLRAQLHRIEKCLALHGACGSIRRSG